MIYVKILDAEGQVTSIEVLDPPVYVYIQPRNGALLRCVQPLGQGLLSADGSVIYQLPDKAVIPQAVATAVIITEAEYYELEATLDQPDVEDATPEVPEGTDEASIMTRAQLTQSVTELQEAMEMILSGVTE